MVARTSGKLGLWLLVSIGALRTTPALSESATPLTPLDLASAPAPRYQVEVTLVGTLSNDTDLRALIDELLEAHGCPHTLRYQAKLLESDLLESADPLGSALIRIWITPPHSGKVRLWFAAPGLDRYLWREVPLPGGLDAVAREQIAQIVQSSSEALKQGHAGFSRSDALRAWQQQQANNGLGEASKEIAARSLVSVRRVNFALASERASNSLRPTASAGYAIAYGAEGLGLLHGPLISLGLDYVRQRHAIGLQLGYEWHFPQSFARAPAKLELKSQLGWLLLVGHYDSSARFGLTSALGVGVEFTTVEPRALGSSNFVASTSYVDRAYWIRLRTGVRGELGPIGWIVSGSADISLSETSFGIDTDQGYEQLLSFWPVRPGLQLGLVFD